MKSVPPSHRFHMRLKFNLHLFWTYWPFLSSSFFQAMQCNNNSYSIYIVLGIINNLEVLQRVGEDVHRWHAKPISLYVRDFSICGDSWTNSLWVLKDDSILLSLSVIFLSPFLPRPLGLPSPGHMSRWGLRIRGMLYVICGFFFFTSYLTPLFTGATYPLEWEEG